MQLAARTGERCLALDTPRGYAICTEPRSGSTFLGRILTSTGVLGRPREYFNAPALRRVDGFGDYPEAPEDQLAAIVSRGVTANGVYGVKVFSEHFDRMAECGWVERLPALSFIHLERRDLLGQAISFLRALQTQQWTAGGEAAAEPAYDGVRIAGLIGHVAKSQARWRRWFATTGLPVLWLVYEEVMADPQGTAERVGDLVGLTEQPRVDADAITRSIIQRDELNDAWRERFLSEFRDVSTLPMRPG